MKKVLVLNFGSTSTKLALYAEDRQILHKEFHHSSDEMGTPFTLKEIAAARKALILRHLKEQGVDLSRLDAVVGRGGLIRPVAGGTYRINEKMVRSDGLRLRLSRLQSGRHSGGGHRRGAGQARLHGRPAGD